MSEQDAQRRAIAGLLGAGALAAVLIGTLVFILPPVEATADVRSVGDAEHVEAAGDAGRFSLGSDAEALPAGHYAVRARFRSGAVGVLELDVVAGEARIVDCREATATCSLDP
ncbi:MAG: hypothetical protein H6734_12470 [Alphaproteobacteria bacterium]|nr:hypothetical protein [Alphaproteobacteria bacterium]